ncbi:hypothetical protein Pint_30128 [Pistacia integerrima]|uniref:Uncharacterized protein n=1 Tax=Pistacia integerrima TaxID=434235 RepID=A0ACC0X4T2_9ROSI|nr:hypothetical protein Pint_30128 [Pistacia integerrima]
MISHLPEHILHHILSFLYFEQAAQACVSSKPWEKAWHTFPYLRFGSEFFNQDTLDFPILQCDPTLFELN